MLAGFISAFYFKRFQSACFLEARAYLKAFLLERRRMLRFHYVRLNRVDVSLEGAKVSTDSMHLGLKPF